MLTTAASLRVEHVVQAKVGNLASIEAGFGLELMSEQERSTVTEEIESMAVGWPEGYAFNTKDHAQIRKNFADCTNAKFGEAIAAELIPYESCVKGWRNMIKQFVQNRQISSLQQPEYIQAASVVSDASYELTKCKLRVHFLVGKGTAIGSKLRQRLDFASSKLVGLNSMKKLAPYQCFCEHPEEPAGGEVLPDWQAGYLIAEAIKMVEAITAELQSLS